MISKIYSLIKKTDNIPEDSKSMEANVNKIMEISFQMRMKSRVKYQNENQLMKQNMLKPSKQYSNFAQTI